MQPAHTRLAQPLDHHYQELASDCCKSIRGFVTKQAVEHYAGLRSGTSSIQDERSVYAPSTLPNHSEKVAVNAKFVAQAVDAIELNLPRTADDAKKQYFKNVFDKTVQQLASPQMSLFVTLLIHCETNKSSVNIGSLRSIKVLVRQFVEQRFSPKAKF